MDWDGIIERNAERLVAVLTELFALAGFGRGGTALLPRHVRRTVLALLRPAESALRRLIVIAARAIVVTISTGGVARAFPKGAAFERDADRVAAFCLIDPLKRFAPEWFEEEQTAPLVFAQVLAQAGPRISVPGLFDPVFPPARPVPAFRPAPESDDLISPDALRRRLIAMRHALDNLPRQAMRLARWRARRALKKIGRLSPFRPGFAPGYQRQNHREIDLILADCHHYAQDAWYDDTS
jgi:hypothetical protein